MKTGVLVCKGGRLEIEFLQHMHSGDSVSSRVSAGTVHVLCMQVLICSVLTTEEGPIVLEPKPHDIKAKNFVPCGVRFILPFVHACTVRTVKIWSF